MDGWMDGSVDGWMDGWMESKSKWYSIEDLYGPRSVNRHLNPCGRMASLVLLAIRNAPQDKLAPSRHCSRAATVQLPIMTG